MSNNNINSGSSGDDVSLRILSTLLNELDGVSSTTSGQVLLLGATNRYIYI
jgi:SpoVK/Ycf46/Vps4 family AAA+-type ATPase